MEKEPTTSYLPSERRYDAMPYNRCGRRVARQSAVTSVLIGASRVEQVEDSVGALENLASGDAELVEIDRLLAG